MTPVNRGAGVPGAGAVSKCFGEFPDVPTPQARNVRASGQDLLSTCPQLCPPVRTPPRPRIRPGPGPAPSCRRRSGGRGGSPFDPPCFRNFRAHNGNSSVESVDDSPSSPQSSVFEGLTIVRYFEPPGPEQSALHGRSPRTAARQIRAPQRCATPFRPGEVRTSASWLFAPSERYATPRGGPPAEPLWSTPMPVSKHRRPQYVTRRPRGCCPCRLRSSRFPDRGGR